jgi:hypothetical protein
MDPITAVSFAASIVTFVDFAWELISGAAELYKSPDGRTNQNAHIETVISDLEDVTDDLGSAALGDSKEMRRLKRLAAKCSELAEELLQLMRKLRLDGNKNSPWKSLVVKWRSMRKSDQVASMEERLREYRSEILLQLSVILK